MPSPQTTTKGLTASMTLGSATVAAAAAPAATWARSTGIAEAGTRPFSYHIDGDGRRLREVQDRYKGVEGALTRTAGQVLSIKGGEAHGPRDWTPDLDAASPKNALEQTLAQTVRPRPPLGRRRRRANTK